MSTLNPLRPPTNKATMSSSLRLHKFRTRARKWVPFLSPKPISPNFAEEQDAPLLRLPAELREIIWETCFRGHLVHVVTGGSPGVRSRECLGGAADDPWTGPHYTTCGLKRLRCGHITLLLACKKMYASRLVCWCPFYSLSNQLLRMPTYTLSRNVFRLLP